MAASLASASAFTGPPPQPRGNALSAHVPDNVALKAYRGAATTLVRDGFASPGDGGLATYHYRRGACPAADEGYQVASAMGGCWKLDAAMDVTPGLYGADTSAASDAEAKDGADALQAALDTGKPVHWSGRMKLSHKVVMKTNGQSLTAPSDARLLLGFTGAPGIQIGDGTSYLIRGSLRGGWVVWSMVDRPVGDATVRMSNCSRCDGHIRIGTIEDEQRDGRRLGDGWSSYNGSLIDIDGDVAGFKGDGIKAWSDVQTAEFHYHGFITGGDEGRPAPYAENCVHFGGGVGGIRLSRGGAEACQVGVRLDTTMTSDYGTFAVDTTAGSSQVTITSTPKLMPTAGKPIFGSAPDRPFPSHDYVRSVSGRGRGAVLTLAQPASMTATHVVVTIPGLGNRELSIDKDFSPDSGQNRSVVLGPYSFSYAQLGDVYTGGAGNSLARGQTLPADWGVGIEIQWPQTYGQAFVNLAGTQIVGDRNDGLRISDGTVNATGLVTRLNGGHGVHLMGSAVQGFNCYGCDLRDSGINFLGQATGLPGCGFKQEPGADNFNLTGGSATGNVTGPVCLGDVPGATRLISDVRGFQTISRKGIAFPAGTTAGDYTVATTLACAPKRVQYSLSSGPASGIVPITRWAPGPANDPTAIVFTLPRTLTAAEAFDIEASCFDR